MARILAALAVAAMTLGACADNSTPSPAAGGTSTTTSSPTASPTPSTSPAGDAATVAVTSSGLGQILVDADGFTLYMFLQDTGSKSTCAGTCAEAWPAYVPTGKVTAGQGADDSLLSTNAAGQVTYAGHPLYRFSGDEAPGDTNGEGISDIWFAVGPDGAKVEKSTGGGQGGYGY
jgi:predicted lipoprotein with Yx(FWY)xxD motif